MSKHFSKIYSSTNSFRVVIFGGGIAGLATAIALKHLGASVKIIERVPQYRSVGHAFNLLPNGLWAAEVLGIASSLRAHGTRIARVLKTDFYGKVLVDRAPDDARILSRQALHSTLLNAFDENCIHMGVSLEYIESNDREGKTVAYLSNGTTIEADLFIAADGINSTARAQLFPNARLNPVKVLELVASPYAPDTASALGETFYERLDPSGGVAYGFASIGDGRVVWFLQVDAQHYVAPNNAKAKQRLAETLMDIEHTAIGPIIQATDFDDCYLWRNTDMPPLPSFYVGRTALVGDAAHPMLSFSVQGMNSALEDAATLMLALKQAPDILDGLALYDRFRRPSAERARLAGYTLMEHFLKPEADKVVDPALYASIYTHTPPSFTDY